MSLSSGKGIPGIVDGYWRCGSGLSALLSLYNARWSIWKRSSQDQGEESEFVREMDEDEYQIINIIITVTYISYLWRITITIPMQMP